MAVLTAVVTSSKTCPFSVGDHDVVSIGLDVLVKLLIVDNISLSLTRCCSLQLQLCGRGSVCYSHNGNQQFRSLVESLKSEYARAEQRLGKSLVIRKVVDGIRSNSGRFIKFDPHSGRAFEVGDVEAVSRNNQWICCWCSRLSRQFLIPLSLQREKTSQAFRDSLQSKYRSSNAFKHKMRKMIRAAAAQKNKLSAPAEFISRNASLSRDFCSSLPIKKGHPEDHLGYALASENLVSVITFGAGLDTNIQDCDSCLSKSTTMDGPTLGAWTRHPTPVLSTALYPTKLDDIPSLSTHSRHIAGIDFPWLHAKFVPFTSHKNDYEVFEQLSSVAVKHDDAGDPFEPFPFEHCFSAALSP